MNHPTINDFFKAILEETPEESAIHFTSIERAFAWLEKTNRDNCYDQHRIVYADELNSNGKEYYEIYQKGCCGSDDTTVIINGRLAFIGCNFGH